MKQFKRFIMSFMMAAILFVFGAGAASVQAASVTVPNLGTTFNGTITSAATVNSYELTVDYALNPSPALAIIRSSGRSGLTLNIIEQSSGSTTTLGMSKDSDSGSVTSRRYHKFVKPAGSATVYTYTLKVTTTAFVGSTPTDYKINTGDAGNMEALLSGRNNATTANRHFAIQLNNDVGSNFQTEHYITNRNVEGTFYRFFNNANTTITLGNNVAGNTLRLRIYSSNGDAVGDVIYDTNSNRTLAQRTNILGSFRNVEKLKMADILNAPLNAFYYVEVYNLANGIAFTETPTGSYTLTIGEPIYQSGSMTLYSSATVSSTNNVWSPDTVIDFSSAPNTAIVREISIANKSGSISSTDFTSIRVRPSTTTTWRESKLTRRGTVEFNPTMLSNVKLKDSAWRIGFKPAGSKLSIVPGMAVSYYAELGD